MNCKYKHLQSSIEKNILEMQVEMQTSPNENHNKQSKIQVQKCQKTTANSSHLCHSLHVCSTVESGSLSRELLAFCRGGSLTWFRVSTQLHNEWRQEAKPPVYSLKNLLGNPENQENFEPLHLQARISSAPVHGVGPATVE